jgi:hypothetical protein
MRLSIRYSNTFWIADYSNRRALYEREVEPAEGADGPKADNKNEAQIFESPLSERGPGLDGEEELIADVTMNADLQPQPATS